VGQHAHGRMVLTAGGTVHAVDSRGEHCTSGFLRRRAWPPVALTRKA
jgi:hypothetical protein